MIPEFDFVPLIITIGILGVTVGAVLVLVLR
jgi:hypothetical protein